MRRITPFSFWLAALLLAQVGGVAHAQVLYGSLTGNIVDPTGAGVPGAKVQTLNVGTGVSRQTQADARGTYLFSDLQAGTYRVTTQSSGFQKRDTWAHTASISAPGTGTTGEQL